MDKPSPVKMGLLLLGSFCIAHAGASLLHELCHSGAAILTGGYSRGIMIHPFNFSYSYSNSVNHPLIHTAAGVLGSSLIAMVLFIVLIRRPKPVLLPLLLIGPVSLMDNGVYWAWDIITGAGCDACNLAQGGISPWLLVSAGVVLCLIGISLTIWLMRAIGFNNEPFKHRLIILSIGVGISSLAGIFWNWYSGMEILWSSGIVFVLVFAWIGGYFRTQESRQYEVSRAVVTGIFIAGIGLVTGLLLISATEKPAFSSSSFMKYTSKTRPDNFPDVLVPHRLGTEPFYAFPPPLHTGRNYLLRYSLPEDANLQEIRNDLETLCREHNYIQLYHEMDVSSKPLDDNWKEETSKVGFKTVRFRHYSQQWIKLAPEVWYIYLSVHSFRREDKFQTAGVMMAAGGESNIDEVLGYVDMHPEGFDLFEVGLLRIKALFGFKISQPPVIMGQ